MEGIVLIVLVVAAAHAIERGRAFAWSRTKSATRSKWQAYTAKRPSVASSSRIGVATGRAIGATAVGLLEGGRGFGAGARVGWAEGRDRAYAWRDRRQASGAHVAEMSGSAIADATLRTATGTDGVGAVFHSGQGTDETPIAAPGGTRARLHLVDDVSNGAVTAEPTDAPAVAGKADGSGVLTNTHSADPEGNDDMTTIDTATGGDVQTMEQLIAELQTIGKEAAAELEDAQGDAHRAQQDVARIDTMVASLSQLNLDSDSLGEIGALSEDAGSRLAAAQARQNAAESRAAHAQQAIDGVQSRHGLMQEAHDATPHAADREFYGH